MGLLRRFTCKYTWVILVLVVLEEITPFVPILGVLLLIGICSTAFMRGLSNFLLKFCESVETGEYCVRIVLEDEAQERVYYCPMFIKNERSKTIIIPRARTESGRWASRIEARYKLLEVAKMPKTK